MISDPEREELEELRNLMVGPGSVSTVTFVPAYWYTADLSRRQEHKRQLYLSIMKRLEEAISPAHV